MAVPKASEDEKLGLRLLSCLDRFANVKIIAFHFCTQRSILAVEVHFMGSKA